MIRCKLQTFVSILFLLIALRPAGSQSVINTIPVGAGPIALAVNPVTNRIYVSDQGNFWPGFSVIDGATGSATIFNTGEFSYGADIAVNPSTNKIYQTGFDYAPRTGHVAIIDGLTNSVTTIAAGLGTYAVAINPATNTIFAANMESNDVTVIDGATNAFRTIPAGPSPYAIAVNPLTNKIYVGNWGYGTITIIDGATYVTTAIPATAGYPGSIAINTATNRIYAADPGGTVTVIDGATNVTTSVPVGNTPQTVAINEITNKIYVANTFGGDITVIDGATNQTSTIGNLLPLFGIGAPGMAIDQATNRIYVTFPNSGGGQGSVYVIDGNTNSIIATLGAGRNPEAIAVNPKTDLVYFANWWDNTVSVIGATAVPPIAAPSLGMGPAQGPTNHQAYIAEPVSTGTGNYYYSHTDFYVPARGIPLLFERFYNSMDDFSGPLGANWNLGYNITLGQSAPGVATVRWGDGHGESYTVQDGSYVPEAGVYSTLVANADGTFTLTGKNQTQYQFSPNGKLVFIQDKNGNQVQMAYDGNGNLITATGGGGRSLSLTYDSNGRISTVSDPLGNAQTFSYDSAGNLATATDPLGGITTYVYDPNHRVTQITLPNGNTLLQNTYDSQGRTVSQTNGRGFAWQFAYDTPTKNQTTITDARGNSTIHTYDGSLRIVGIIDASGHTTGYAYDSSNNRTSVTNQNGNTTAFAYDANGNVTSATDALGNTTSFAFDAKNDLLSVTNPKGKSTVFSYDSHGNLITTTDALGNTTTQAYDSTGQLTSKTDANGNVTQFRYSAAGDLTGITDALGNATTMAYDGDGHLVSVTDPNQHTSTSAYDAVGRLTASTDALGDQTKSAYDSVGNLLSVTDANGHTTSYAYDAVNNLVAVTDALGHVTHYTYDADNNRTAFTNAKGNTTTYQYDALNRLAKSTDPLGFVTGYEYDPVGNVVAVTDPKRQTNRFTYDAMNRLAAIAYADGKNVAYKYDVDGNRSSMVDWTGSTRYAYDDLDRVTSITFPGKRVVAYSYDATGRRATLTYPDGKSVSYGYDADERLATVTDYVSHTTQYSYDTVGNLAAVKYPNSARIDFAYDAAHRLTSVTNTTVGVPPLTFEYTLDPVGNRTVVKEAGIPTRYGYDALNQLTSSRGLYGKELWKYDAVGNRLTQHTPLGYTKYIYDASDRLLKAGYRKFWYDANGNQTAAIDLLTHQKRTYSFNAANRLVAVDGGLTSRFVYDGDGNRVSQSVGRSTITYDNDIAAALPMVLQDSSDSTGINRYVYGLNLVEAFHSQSNDFYQYDGLGSVVQLTDLNGQPQTSYLYDVWGNTILPVPTTNPFRFTGQTFDVSTGFYYLRARYYDPRIGRLISGDLLPGNKTVPLSKNRYIYAVNDPACDTDPSGFTAMDISNTSFAQDVFDNLGSIVQSWTKTAASSVLNFASTEIGLLQVKVQQLQIQSNRDLPSDARAAVDWYVINGGTPIQALAHVLGYGAFGGLSSQQKADYEKLFNQELVHEKLPPVEF